MRRPAKSTGCLYRKSDSAIIVMKSAEDGRRYDAAHVLDGAMDRSVLVERPMSPQLVIVGGILRQNVSALRPRQPHGRRTAARHLLLSHAPFRLLYCLV